MTWSENYWATLKKIKEARVQAAQLMENIELTVEEKRKLVLVVTDLDNARLWLEDVAQ